MNLKKLSQNDADRLTAYYVDALEKYGAGSPQALHWINKKNQQSRFEILCSIGDLSGKSVLDVGCGLGDLYPYLHDRYTNVDYTGIDIIPEIVTAARTKYPLAEFIDTTVYKVYKNFDFVLSSGALTFKVDDYKNFYFAMIQQMYELANIGVAFNMLRDGYFMPNDAGVDYKPDEVVDFCKTFAADYQVISGYLDGDFTVFLFKDTKYRPFN